MDQSCLRDRHNLALIERRSLSLNQVPFIPFRICEMKLKNILQAISDTTAIDKILLDLGRHDRRHLKQHSQSNRIHDLGGVVSDRQENATKPALPFLTTWLVASLRNAGNRSQHAIEKSDNLTHGYLRGVSSQYEAANTPRNAFNYSDSPEIDQDLLKESPRYVVLFGQLANRSWPLPWDSVRLQRARNA